MRGRLSNDGLFNPDWRQQAQNWQDSTWICDKTKEEIKKVAASAKNRDEYIESLQNALSRDYINRGLENAKFSENPVDNFPSSFKPW
jgi:hypothetical protein